MGPTNVALVKLFEADRKLRDVQAKLEAASHNVRIQERRVNDLSEKLRLAQQTHKERLAKSAQMDLELKARDAHIEKLRTQQQAAKNNKEYQALLVEINTRKVDRAKIEEQALANLEALEKLKVEGSGLTTGLAAEKAKLDAMKAQSGETLAALQAEVDAVKPERAAAEAAVPPKTRDLFNRLADKYDGEAMAGIDRPDRRKEEYLCTACNMELVRDVYNKLNSRDDVVFCPNCQRMLFIPDHFTAEHAIGGPTKSSAAKKPKVTVVRQRTAAPKKSKAAAAAAPETTGSAAIDASAAASATAGQAGMTEEEKDVVVIEARATGALGKALASAQGESVSRAIKSDTNPVECEVYVDGSLAGIYKGISVENLERAIKYFLGEQKLTYTTLQVKAAGSATVAPSEQSASEQATSEQAASAPTEAAAGGAPEAQIAAATDATTPAGDPAPAAGTEAQTSESIPAPEATPAH